MTILNRAIERDLELDGQIGAVAAADGGGQKTPPQTSGALRLPPTAETRENDQQVSGYSRKGY